MGINGDQARKSFRNGDQGRGRGRAERALDRVIARDRSDRICDPLPMLSAFHPTTRKTRVLGTPALGRIGSPWVELGRSRGEGQGVGKLPGSPGLPKIAEIEK